MTNPPDTIADARSHYVDAFASSAIAVFASTLDTELTVGEATYKERFYPNHEISGVIEFKGSVHGTVVISLEPQAAFHATDAMLGLYTSELNDDVRDVVGELTNMIAEQAKSRLGEASIGLPQIITGTKHFICFPVDPISIPLQSAPGRLCIDVGLIHLAN